MKVFGGIEAGGTKFVCGIGSQELGIVEQTVIPTKSPAETLPGVIRFFEEACAEHELLGVGVGAFGPIGLEPGAGFGVIGNTPKAGWAGYDLIDRLSAGIRTAFSLDTDVGVAARAEHRMGNARGLDHFVYVTVGTGIGGAVFVNGQFVRGALHPEFGHMRIPHDLERDPFAGVCPYHDDCLEGLASGPSADARAARTPGADRDDPWIRELQAAHIANGLMNVIYVVAPQRIVLGGGVIGDDETMLDEIRRQLLESMKGYAVSPAVSHPDFIMHPGLGSSSGVTGAMLLAEEADAGSTR